MTLVLSALLRKRAYFFCDSADFFTQLCSRSFFISANIGQLSLPITWISQLFYAYFVKKTTMTTVIVPLDFSQTSLNAAHYTAGLYSNHPNVHVILYHFLDSPHGHDEAKNYLDTLKGEF